MKCCICKQQLEHAGQHVETVHECVYLVDAYECPICGARVLGERRLVVRKEPTKEERAAR